MSGQLALDGGVGVAWRLAFTVSGAPKPQGSKSWRPVYRGPVCGVCRQRRLQRVVLYESVTGLGEWRERVAWTARAAMGGSLPVAGPLAASMVFAVARPAAHYRSGRFAHLLREDAPRWPAQLGRNDLSKYCRAVEDALTGVVWADDGLVAEYRLLLKVFAGEDPRGPALPGVRVEVSGLGDDPV